MGKIQIFRFADSIVANAISIFGLGSILVGLIVALGDGMWAVGIRYMVIGVVLNIAAVILNKVVGKWKAEHKAPDEEI